MSSSATSYDPNVIIQAAEEKLIASNDFAGGQTLFQSALLNWVDDAQFSNNDDGTNTGATTNGEQLREAIATLWIAYAHFLQKAKQMKSAVEAYEQAISCPIGSQAGKVWLDYARFLEERGKRRAAQQVYIRALVDDDATSNPNNINGGRTDLRRRHHHVVMDEQDRDLLWNEFLEMMRTNQPDLTLNALKKAVAEEHLLGKISDPSETDGQHHPQVVTSSSAGVGNTENDNDNENFDDDNDHIYSDLQFPKKKRRLNHQAAGSAIKQEGGSDHDGEELASTRTHVVTASDVKTEETALMDIIQDPKSDPQFLAAWMVQDGDAPPQAPNVSLFEAAPPKLSDPTGKDLLGEELALQLIQLLLSATGGVILQICRGLWMMTALTEYTCQKRLSVLDSSFREELDTLQQRLDDRLSVAGAAEAAVRAVNETEKQAFQSNCNEKRQTLLNEEAWEFRKLLWMQQQLLTKLQIPAFDGPSVDAAELELQARICSYLHSAFFLRQRIGEESHVKMLQSQETRLKHRAMEDSSMIMGGSSSRGVSPVSAGGGVSSRFSPKFHSNTTTGRSLSPFLMPQKDDTIPSYPLFQQQPPEQSVRLPSSTNLGPILMPAHTQQLFPPTLMPPQSYGGIPVAAPATYPVPHSTMYSSPPTQQYVPQFHHPNHIMPLPPPTSHHHFSYPPPNPPFY